ncbi:uncharacterized protein LOC116195450 [Punica granatum]|uniref:Uncharacterized protein LOC116195450 n=1 Tax=Punica granatum TaxID=22663 RepID=A0A6P8C9U7_PUNGR|nr:uncharacterized protein LOC116195450 [Punica granatum]
MLFHEPVDLTEVLFTLGLVWCLYGQYDSHASTHFPSLYTSLLLPHLHPSNPFPSASSIIHRPISEFRRSHHTLTRVHGGRAVSVPGPEPDREQCWWPPSDKTSISFALKSSSSSSSSSSLHQLLLRVTRTNTTTATTSPRFSMRVASKQAYIAGIAGTSTTSELRSRSCPIITSVQCVVPRSEGSSRICPP